MNTKDATSQLMALQNRINKTAQKIEALTRKQQELGTTKVPTKEYAEIQAHLQKAEGQMDKLLAKQAKMQAMGNTKGSAWKSLQMDMEELGRAIEADRIDMQQLVAEGRAFSAGNATDEYQRINLELQNANNEMAQLNQKARELIQKENQASNGAKKFGKTMKSSSQKASKGLGNLARTMKQMILSMAVFNIMFKGLEFLKSGLQNLAVYSKEYNKSMSELTSSTSQLKNAFAVAFQPILNMVIPILSKLINWISAAANAVSHFFAALGGKSTYTRAIKQNKDYAASLDKVGGSSEDAKGSLAGFDDLNVLQDNSSSGGSGGSATGADPSGFEEVSVDSKMSELAAKVQEILAPFKEVLTNWWGNLDFQPLIDSLISVKTAAEPLFTIVADGLLWMLENVWLPLASWVIEDAAPVYFETLATVLGVLASILETVQPLFTWAWENFFIPLGEWTGGLLLTILSELGNIISRLWFEILQPFIEWFQATILPIIQPILDGLVASVRTVFDIMAGIVSGLIEILNGIITFLSGIFTGDWQKAFQGISDIVNGIFNTIQTYITGVMTIIFGKVKSILQTLSNVWNTLWGGMKNGVINTFNKIWSGIKNVINKIIAGVEKMANGVINGINGMINALNNLSFSIPDWVPGLGGQSFGLSINTLGTVSIPRLANGGITTGSTLANIGEAGREAVLPLENNTGWMDDLAEKLASKMPSYRAGTMVLELDGRELARAELPYFDAEASRIGLSLIPT